MVFRLGVGCSCVCRFFMVLIQWGKWISGSLVTRAESTYSLFLSDRAVTEPCRLGCPKPDLFWAPVAHFSVEHGVELRKRLGSFSAFGSSSSQPQTRFVGTEPSEFDLRKAPSGTHESGMESPKILI